jgi:REP element-mobilizing transposase RayT
MRMMCAKLLHWLFLSHHGLWASQRRSKTRRYILPACAAVAGRVILQAMKRLSRLEMVFTDAPVYFITASTEKRRHLIANDRSHEVLRRFCMLARDRGVLVGRYVLMPDHFHLFVCIPPGAVGLSMWMKSLKNTMSKHWREDGIGAPHWQKGFFDHLIRSSESHAEKWKYVRENPVRAGLVERAEDWPYAGAIQPDSWT